MADNIGIKVGLSLDTTQGTKEFNDWSNRTRAQLQKNPIKVNLQIDGQAYEKKIETFINANRELAQVTTYTNKATGEQYAQVTKTASAFEQCASAEQKLTNVNKNLSNAQQKLNTHVKQSTSLFKDFTATFMKMAKFNTINMIYDGIINKMSEAIQITNDFDAAMTEFKKVTDTTSLSLSDYTEQLGQLGEATARSATQMLEASTEFSKSGYDANTSAQLAQTATLFQNIADSEVSAGDAASFIISQMKAYSIEANNAVSILDKVNETSNSFAVSSTDITSALTKQSASLAAYGNSLDESIALVTAGTEIMTGQAGKVARGLRTIGANITQLAQNAKEFDITVNGATKTIQLWNETGTDMLNTYDVLKQISAEWDNMTNAEKSSLAVDLAKKTQMDTFLAVLGNFEDAEKAYTTALLSEGSAWKENEKYMESIEAHQAKLKAEWENFVLSKPFADLEKALLDTATALLKFIQSDLGQAIIKITAFIGVVLLAGKAVTALYTLFMGGNAISMFVHMLGAAITGTTSLTAAVNFLTAAMDINPLFLAATAIALGITAVVAAVDLLTTSFEEQTQQLQDATDAYEKAQSEVESLENKLKTLQEELDKTNKLKLETTDESELQNLEKQTRQYQLQEASLRNQLAIAKAKRLEAEKEAEKEAREQKTKITTTTAETSSGTRSFTATGTTGQILQQDVSELVKVRNEITENQKQIDELSKSYEENANKIGQLNAKNGELMEYYIALSSNGAQFAESSQQIIDRLGEYSIEVDGVKVNVADLIKLYGQLVDWGEGVENSSKGIAETMDEESDGYEDAGEKLTEFETVVSDFIGFAEDAQSSYEVLSKAAEEYNKQGYLSASTLKQLTKIQPEYLAQLDLTGEKAEVVNGALQNQFEIEKQLALIHIQTAEQLDIVAYCQEYLGQETDKTTNALADDVTNTQALTTAYGQLTDAGYKAAKAIATVRAKGRYDDDFEAGLNKRRQRWKDYYDEVNAIELDYASSSKSNAGSHKDAWVEAFEEEQRQLKHSLEMNEITELEYYERLKDLNEKYFGEISGNHQKYIKEYQENEEEIYKGTKAVYDKVKDYLREAVEQGYERAINALKKEEKAVLAEIKKQIEGLKREKKAVLDGIKDEINALKKQKEQVQKYYNDQIDAIKKENEVLQEQNQLLEYQQQLQQAKTQKVMVIQDGKFQLGENESAVAQAEQNLNNYKDQLSYEQQIKQLEELRDAQVEAIEARIQSLEEYYEYMEDYYDRQIEAMEDYYNRVQEQYEKQIEALQQELDTFKEGYQKSEDLDNARLAAEVLAANEEASVWKSRLENLATAITEYNRLLSLMGEEGEVATSGYTGSSVGYNHIAEISGVDAAISKIEGRASGDASFKGDEVALVGESPNTELVLGSRLNRSLGGGSLVNLSKGSGVVNAESTRTLAGLLNGLANPQSVSNSRTTQQTFTFGSISLPNVTNAETFVGALRDKFNNYSIQSTTIKK